MLSLPLRRKLDAGVSEKADETVIEVKFKGGGEVCIWQQQDMRVSEGLKWKACIVMERHGLFALAADSSTEQPLLTTNIVNIVLCVLDHGSVIIS